MSRGLPRSTRRRIQLAVLRGREVKNPAEAPMALAYATRVRKQRVWWMALSFPFILVFGGIVNVFYDVVFAGLGLEHAIRWYASHPFEFVFWVQWICVGLGLPLWQRTMAERSTLKNEALLTRIPVNP